MALHMMKMAAGIKDLDGLRAAIGRRGGAGPVVISTRNMPKRLDELLDGGSLYWVGGGSILGRQTLLDISEGTRGDGSRTTLITLDPEVVAVERLARTAFQGWRYLEGRDVPADVRASSVASVDPEMPPRLRRELAALGLL